MLFEILRPNFGEQSVNVPILGVRAYFTPD